MAFMLSAQIMNYYLTGTREPLNRTKKQPKTIHRMMLTPVKKSKSKDPSMTFCAGFPFLGLITYKQYYCPLPLACTKSLVHYIWAV